MQKQLSSEGLLIVMELGAEWPTLQGIEVAPGSRRVLTQHESETPSAFSVRVGEQLDTLFARGVSLKSAIVACNDRLDAAASGARAELARTAASAMARARGGSLTLLASEHNEARGRESLTALTAELAKEWQTAAVETKLQFGGNVSAPRAEAASKPTPSSRRGKAAGKDGTRRVA